MEEMSQPPTGFEELADYRRRVAELYIQARQVGIPPEQRWVEFRREREKLFATHPQSALTPEQRRTFEGLQYFIYNPALRFVLPVQEVEVDSKIMEVDLPDEGVMRLQRFGKVAFEVEGQAVSLTLFWVKSYGGGIFLPFRDLTNQKETYGGGRYILDTIKYADLGREPGGLVIDFNFAYNPSCAYNPHWVCPLAPAENWLGVPIWAGELRFPE
jgi:uncharacterized protein (DUF1684 family)